jgi:poly(A) polymerase
VTKKSNSHTPPIIYDYEMPRESVDLDALSIVRRLDRSDYLAYFVGGSVRDSLLGVTPKDFDIATSARPRDVRKVFKNCRLIGKRFTLAHVYFSHDKIIEVATFRTKPSVEEQDDGLIISDNEFGTAESDAERRDFTINALYYDPLRHEIIDYCGGMEDVYRRVLRTIGEPVVRFREDPVRMLRAVKFAARLDLSFEPSLEAALRSERLELLKAARPRFAQELLRFLQGGAARRSYELLEELDYLSLMLPELSASWTQRPSVREQSLALLGALDELNAGQLSDESALIALLWWPTFSQLTSELHASPKQLKWVAARLLAPLFARVRLSLKHLYAASRVLAELSVMSRGESVSQGGGKKGQPKKSKLSSEAAVIYGLWCEVIASNA